MALFPKSKVLKGLVSCLKKRPQWSLGLLVEVVHYSLVNLTFNAQLAELLGLSSSPFENVWTCHLQATGLSNEEETPEK